MSGKNEGENSVAYNFSLLVILTSRGELDLYMNLRKFTLTNFDWNSTPLGFLLPWFFEIDVLLFGITTPDLVRLSS